MKTNLYYSIIAVFTLALSTPVYSKGNKGKAGGKAGKKGGRPDAAAVFAAIDENGDDIITAKELGDSRKFKNADKKQVGAAFKEKDLNDDGKITPREWARTFGRHGGKGKGKGRN